MGLFDAIKKQFINVLEWNEQNSDRIIYKFPVAGNEIKMGAVLTVRPAQVAIFLNEGTIADVFQEGRYELSTQNMPVMTTLQSWKFGFNSPFKADVYFVNMKNFIDQKWGTTNPIMLRDADFGIVRLRGFGTFSYRVSDPVKFMTNALGTDTAASTDDFTPQFKRQAVSALADLIAESKVAALDLAMHYDEMGASLKEKMRDKFDYMGLTITDFTIENLSLPPEVEAAMDKRSAMGALGDLNRYTQYQAAEAIGDAAANPGGIAGDLAGIGVAMGMGQVMSQAMQQGLQPQVQPQAPVQAAGTPCPKCGQNNPAGSRFCAGCGSSLTDPVSKPCIQCGKPMNPDAKFCPECGASQAQPGTCPACGMTIAPGTKFCPGCGAKISG